jgi:hypothetical protein
MRELRVIAVLGLLLAPLPYAYAATSDDAYIAGYAAGTLKHQLNLELPSLVVQNRVITLPTAGLNAAERAKAVQVLSDIPGVEGVKLADAKDRQAQAPGSAAVRIHEGRMASGYGATILPTGLLPEGHLFKPLLADPRWTRFSAAYRNYQSQNFDGADIGSVSFGETIPFYRSYIGRSSVQWEAGLQAGVFSDFNLSAPSSDLVNSDFVAALFSSIRFGHFSGFGRLYHQSSHLGDEFLLRQINTGFSRINLSYEGVDLKLSYELPFGVRLYGGGAGLFHKDPSALKTWSSQYGLEFHSPWRIGNSPMRPVLAVDVKNHEQNDWNTDISAKAGIEFDNLQVLGRKLQILGEYYNGYSPTGQFYKDKVEYYGIGAQYLF